MKRMIIIPVFVCLFKMIFSATIDIGMSEWIGWSFLNVAQDKGIFKKNGLDVRISNYSSCYDNLMAFNEHKTDVIIDMIGTLISNDIECGDTKILFATNMSSGGDKIISRKGESITDIYTYSDNIAITYFINKTLDFRKIIHKNEYIQFEPEFLISKFKEGKIHTIVVYEPYVTVVLESCKDAEVIASSADIEYIIPEGIAIHEDSISKEDTYKLLLSIIEALEWTGDPRNRKELYRIIREKTIPSYGSVSNAEIEGMINSVDFLDRDRLLDYNINYIDTYIKDIIDYYNYQYGSNDYKVNIDKSAIISYYKVNIDKSAIISYYKKIIGG